VNDIPRFQPAAARDDGVTDFDRPLSDGLGLDLAPAGALDRARDAGSHPEMVVGSVCDRIHVQRRDVSLDDLQLHDARLPPARAHRRA
jgi:hypothetical protein